MNIVDAKLGYDFQTRYQYFLAMAYPVETVTHTTYGVEESSGSGPGGVLTIISVVVALLLFVAVGFLYRYSTSCCVCSTGLKMASMTTGLETIHTPGAPHISNT